MATRADLRQPVGWLPYAWRVGEHVALIGDTGSGKSTLAAALLAGARRYYVIVRTKPDDVEYAVDLRTGRAADIGASPRIDRIELSVRRPSARSGLTLKAAQRVEISAAIDRIWAQGGWTLYLDELWYLDSELGLRDRTAELLTQARSYRISVVTGMQRPVAVNRWAISQARHVISGPVEGRDLVTLAQATTPWLADEVAKLGEYEFAWWHRRSGRREVWRGRLQDLQALP